MKKCEIKKNTIKDNSLSNTQQTKAKPTKISKFDFNGPGFQFNTNFDLMSLIEETEIDTKTEQILSSTPSSTPSPPINSCVDSKNDYYLSPQYSNFAPGRSIVK